MEGPEGAVTAIVGVLRTGLPGKLAEFRTRYGVTDGSLEDVTRFLTHEPVDIAVDRPPMVVVAEQESDTVDGPLKIATDGSGGAVYLYRYRVAVYAWARGTSFDTTTLARQRYGLAVREVLLGKPGLGNPDPGTLVLDPATIIETYSGAVVSEGSREVIAATALVCEYLAQEYLAPAPGRLVTDIDAVVLADDAP